MHRLLPLLLIGCGRYTLLSPPEPPSNAQTAVVAYFVGNQRPEQIYPFRLPDYHLPVPLDGDVVVMFYEQSPELLGFESGVPLVHVEIGRPLPDYDEAHIHSGEDWSLLSRRPAALTGFTIAAGNLDDCPACITARECVLCEDNGPVVPGSYPIEPPLDVVRSCPADWTETPEGCVPDSPAFIRSCPDGTAQFHGATDCEPVAPCAGTFPPDLPPSTVFVDATVSGPGTGTEIDPFSSFPQRAISVALFPGEYEVTAGMLAGVTNLDGLCGDAILKSDSPLELGSATVRNLTIEAPLVAQGDVTLENVILARSPGAGLQIFGSADLHRVLVFRTDGPGIIVGGGLTANQLVVREAYRFGVTVGEAASATITEAIVRDTRFTLPPPRRRSDVLVNGRLMLERAKIGRNEFNADEDTVISVAGGELEGASIELERGPNRAVGIRSDAGRVLIQGLYIERTHAAAIEADNSRVSLGRATLHPGDEEAIVATGGGELQLANCYVQGSNRCGGDGDRAHRYGAGRSHDRRSGHGATIQDGGGLGG